MIFINYYVLNGELYHHGVKGQKWGVRRYQNPDGTLTARGRKARVKELNREYKTLYRNRDQLRSVREVKAEYDTKMMNKQKEAEAYAKKHHLDFDDGGGGSQKAAKHYHKLWDDYYKIEAQKEQAIRNSIELLIANKYGKEAYSDYINNNKRRDKAIKAYQTYSNYIINNH